VKVRLGKNGRSSIDEGGLAMKSWELIFRQSRVNNGIYDGDRLPGQNWQWPQGTWLQTRLRYLRHGRSRQSGELTATRAQ
jgi:hypothetical protein